MEECIIFDDILNKWWLYRLLFIFKTYFFIIGKKVYC